MNEAHRQFCAAYEIKDVAHFAKLYALDEIILFLPPRPTEAEKQALQQLIGVQGETYGYMDYVQSNNSFELIMQWRERTNHW